MFRLQSYIAWSLGECNCQSAADPFKRSSTLSLSLASYQPRPRFALCYQDLSYFSISNMGDRKPKSVKLKEFLSRGVLLLLQ